MLHVLRVNDDTHGSIVHQLVFAEVIDRSILFDELATSYHRFALCCMDCSSFEKVTHLLDHKKPDIQVANYEELHNDYAYWLHSHHFYCLRTNILNHSGRITACLGLRSYWLHSHYSNGDRYGSRFQTSSRF